MWRWTAMLAALAVLSCVPAAWAADGPLPPRDPYVEAKRPDEVVLTWRSGLDPAPDGERYAVFRDGVRVGETDTPRFVDTWLLESTRYEYVVRAILPEGESADSVAARITTPPSRAFEIGPYLQQLTPTGVEVVWQTYEPATTVLRFGPAGGPLGVVVRDAALQRRHAVPIRDLLPGAAYSYQWESDGKQGAVSAFRTPAAGPDRFSFGVIGDFGIGTPAARANLRRMSADPAVDLAITTGDNAQIYGTEDEYRRFVLGPLRDLIATKPFWPSVGNHDYYNLQNYLRFFALPNGGLYYSFTYGGVLFVALDSTRFDGRQRSWLRAQLSASAARCKVAYVHHPLWSSGRGYKGHTRHLRRARFVPILQRGGVDLVLNGHMQNYERSKPLRSGRRSNRGIVYIVTGGGGASLNPFVTKRRPKWSARRGIFYHRLRIAVDRHTFRGKAIDSAGNTRDRFRVPCRPG
jgi:acid phosphatase type 7